MKRIGKILPLLLAIACWPASAAAETHFQRMHRYYTWMDAQATDAAVFIGDSITQGLMVENVYPKSINFGIGGDTTGGVLYRIKKYNSIHTAPFVVIAVGTNDSYRSVAKVEANITQILDAITVPVILSGIHPVGLVRNMGRANARISEFNAMYERVCAERPNCTFVPSPLADENGLLPPEYSIGDGVHLNALGYSLWTEALKAALP